MSNKYVTCPSCNGKGSEKCYNCNGTGLHYYDDYDDEQGEIRRVETCPRCGGSGHINCTRCNGNGEIIDRY